MIWPRRLQPIVRPLYQAYSRVSRGMTLGVRAVAFNPAGEIVLVEHTYTPGWHLPGGGVERGETGEEAVVRELQEEAGLKAIGRPKLLAVHANHTTFKGDHVLVYRIDAWEPCEARADGEIHQVAWFAPDALPPGVTAATRRRIAEAVGGAGAP
jgi:ADP-ribose pyrophosphatase YjhB (NUDIX family)